MFCNMERLCLPNETSVFLSQITAAGPSTGHMGNAVQSLITDQASQMDCCGIVTQHLTSYT